MIEPTADMRVFAASMMQMYQALIQAGFSESQAMGIIGTTLAASIGQAGQG